MKEITIEELDKILDLHHKWLNDIDGGVRANLENTNLTNADLTNADLGCADLGCADLSNADLGCANLYHANLYNADLRGADLRCADLPHFQICPEEGDFIGWKKVRGDIVLKLLITGKRTSSLVGRKCRCSECKVLCAYDMDGNEIFDKTRLFFSSHDHDFTYQVGEFIIPDRYDGDIRVECSTGIHFFITRKEAEEY